MATLCSILAWRSPWADCTRPFYLRDLSIMGTVIHEGSWKQFPMGTKGNTSDVLQLLNINKVATIAYRPWTS